MTRELKLAMVIGFALLLLLAILVSDHFSAADLRQQTLLESSQPRHALAAAPPPAIRELPPAAELVVEPLRPSAPSRLADAPPSIPAEVRPLGGGTGRGLADAAAAAPTPARSTAPVPTERIHRVAEGESLSRIAERIYGDRELWKALAAYNTDRLPNPNVLKTGLVLRIPPKEVLTGGATAPATTNIAVRDPLAAPPPSRAHVVREGETLSEIAAATLGSSRRWPELVAANRDRIADPDRVMPGTELRIPVASSQ
jgi:nucleoid-associated protein YgaU